MSGEPQLFRVNPESRQSERIEEVDFARLGLPRAVHASARTYRNGWPQIPVCLTIRPVDNRQGIQRIRPWR